MSRRLGTWTGALLLAGCMVLRGERPDAAPLPPPPADAPRARATYSLVLVQRLRGVEEQRHLVVPSAIDREYPRPLAAAFLDTGWFETFLPSRERGEVHFALELEFDRDPMWGIDSTGTLVDILLLPVQLVLTLIPRTDDSRFRLRARVLTADDSVECDFRDEYTLVVTAFLLPILPFELGALDIEHDAYDALARAVVGGAVERGLLPVRRAATGAPPGPSAPSAPSSPRTPGGDR